MRNVDLQTLVVHQFTTVCFVRPLDFFVRMCFVPDVFTLVTLREKAYLNAFSRKVTYKLTHPSGTIRNQTEELL